jgi:type II secretory pathway component PulJ
MLSSILLSLSVRMLRERTRHKEAEEQLAFENAELNRRLLALTGASSSSTTNTNSNANPNANASASTGAAAKSATTLY